MSIPAAWPRVLDLFGTPLVFERSPGQLPGDAGLRVARQFDECVGLTRVFAKVVDGPRATGLTERSLSGRARARVVGILAGCQDRDGRGYRLDS